MTLSNTAPISIYFPTFSFILLGLVFRQSSFRQLPDFVQLLQLSPSILLPIHFKFHLQVHFHFQFHFHFCFDFYSDARTSLVIPTFSFAQAALFLLSTLHLLQLHLLAATSDLYACICWPLVCFGLLV